VESIQPLLFWGVALLTCVCAIATVVTQNIVRAATWLLFTLAGTSALFFLLGADLVGAVQLLVYVGGTLVLVVFGVMLTAQGPFIHMQTSGAEWAISALAGLLLMGVLAVGILAPSTAAPPKDAPVVALAPKHRLVIDTAASATRRAELQKALDAKEISKDEYDDAIKALERAQAAQSPYTSVIGQGFLGVGVGPAHKSREGVVRANYLLPFEIVSVHLLVVLIGAAYLARAKRRRSHAS
jgi:NADH-quinone oxidoreductase subunit J